MGQIQSQVHKQKQVQGFKQIQTGVQYEKPVIMDLIEDEEAEEEFVDDMLDEEYQKDDFDDYDDMSGDLDFEPEDELEEIPTDFKNFSVAEINIIGGKLVISISNALKNNKEALLRSSLKLIIEKNSDFIWRKTEKINEISQTELGSKDASIVSRFLRNNFFSFPDGIIYSLGTFFSNKPGKRSEDADKIEIFFSDMLSKETELITQRYSEGFPISKDLLYSDTKIAKEYSLKFESKSRKTVERLREKLKIKSIEERYKDYLNIYKS